MAYEAPGVTFKQQYSGTQQAALNPLASTFVSSRRRWGINSHKEATRGDREDPRIIRSEAKLYRRGAVATTTTHCKGRLQSSYN